MVIQTLISHEKRTNYFLSDEEVSLIWNYATKHFSSKWVAMLGMALFRGKRIGEIVAMNLEDFLNEEFNKITIVLEKSHIKDDFPLIAGFAAYLKEYITKNLHTFKDGWLFPFYSKKSSTGHIDIKTADAWMAKVRNGLGENYPAILERKKIIQLQYRILKLLQDHPSLDSKALQKAFNRHQATISRCLQSLYNKGYLGYNGVTEAGIEFLQNPSFSFRYRVNWHSCRRWFETKLDDKGIKTHHIADIMRYKDRNTPLTYIDPYRIWKSERSILEYALGDYWRRFNDFSKGQTKLTNFQ